ERGLPLLERVDELTVRDRVEIAEADARERAIEVAPEALVDHLGVEDDLHHRLAAAELVEVRRDEAAGVGVCLREAPDRELRVARIAHALRDLGHDLRHHLLRDPAHGDAAYQKPRPRSRPEGRYGPGWGGGSARRRWRNSAS